MGHPCSQERGLEEGLSPSDHCPAEKLRTQLWKLDCEVTRAAAGNSGFFPGVAWNSTAGQKESSLGVKTQGHAPPPPPREAARGT